MNKIKTVISILSGLLIFCYGCGSTPEQPVTEISMPTGSAKVPEKKPEIIKGPLTLNSIIEYMEANNPELKSLNSKIKAADADIAQMKLWPNPEVILELREVPTDNIAIDEGRKAAGIVQPIETGGKRDARVNIAQEKKDVATLSYEQRKSELVLEANKIFNALLLSQEEISIIKERLEIETSLSAITQKAYSEGRLPQEEFLDVETKLSYTRLNLQEKEEAVKNNIVNIRKLLGVNESFPLECAGKLEPLLCDVDLAKLKEAMLANNPQIKLSQAGVKISNAQLAKDLADRVPDIKVGIGYMKDEGTHDNLLGLSIGFPLPIFNRNQGKIAQTKSEIISAKEQVKSVENNLTSVLSQVINNYQVRKSNLTIYQSKILPNEQKGYAIAEESYKAGRGSYQQQLSAKLRLLNATLEYVKIVKALNDNTAELEYLCGKIR